MEASTLSSYWPPCPTIIPVSQSRSKHNEDKEFKLIQAAPPDNFDQVNSNVKIAFFHIIV